MLLTFSAFVGLVGKSPIKTLVATAFGFILAAVGIDIVSGELRMTFGLTPLMGGFNFIVAVIGLFGIGEILLTVEEGLKFEGVKVRMRWSDITRTLQRHAAVLEDPRPGFLRRRAGWVSSRAAPRRPPSWPTGLPRKP